jgi:hypothetical protein
VDLDIGAESRRGRDKYDPIQKWEKPAHAGRGMKCMILIQEDSSKRP